MKTSDLTDKEVQIIRESLACKAKEISKTINEINRQLLNEEINKDMANSFIAKLKEKYDVLHKLTKKINNIEIEEYKNVVYQKIW